MSSLVTTLWVLSLVIGLVVTLIAVALLTAVLRVARDIDTGARHIWVTGKLVARNTVHIPDLRRTNQLGADILEEAGGILGAAQRIRAHAAGCPGCPACLLKQGSG